MGMPPRVEREYTGFFDVVEILRARTKPSREEVQKKQIMGALNYLTSARDAYLQTSGMITSYDIEGSIEDALDHSIKLVGLIGHLDEFGTTEADYLTALNKYISLLHILKAQPEIGTEPLNNEEKGDLEKFLYNCQKALNSGLGNI